MYINTSTSIDRSFNLQVRHQREGTQTYFSSSVYGGSFTAIHDHANNVRTIGMGEVNAVLNGVDFRTRHNDYGLRMASTSSSDYNAVEDIPFPDVPPSVTGTVLEQVVEMREWFKAWRDQNHTVRDYRQYFKPVLCYMEGMWTLSDEELEESFESDRHFIDASNWHELEEKIRFSAYAGIKGSGENLAFLPRIVMNVTEDGIPQFAQWNYDILCQPLANDVPFDRYRVVDDISARMRNKFSVARLETTRLARFQLNTVDEPFTHDSEARHQYLDSLMKQVPGKSGPNAYFEDRGLEDKLFMDADDTDTALNAAFYNRAYFVRNRDAMGRQFRYRGFADENLYMAMTDQDKVAGIDLTICKWRNNCPVISQKWTYAIPLEIIYMTPLSKWNPYNIPYRGQHGEDGADAVTAGGRNGNQAKPFDGTNSKNYYITPAEFYDATSSEIDRDAADTTPQNAVYVLDSQGVARAVKASGYRVLMPDIEGVGVLRQRWPIAPVHGEGSMFWKQIEALKEIVMDPLSHGHLMTNPINAAAFAGTDDTTFFFKTSPSNAATMQHEHEFTLTSAQFVSLSQGRNVTVTTNQANGHTHTLLLYAQDSNTNRVRYHTCDGNNGCWDGHWRGCTQITELTVS